MVPLSPAEETGLGGLSLDSRLRRLFYTLPQAAMLGLTGKLAEEAVRRKLVYLRDGVAEPIRIMLRPIGVMPEQLSYVHHVTLTILDALRRLPDLYLRDLEVRRVVPLDPPEEEWLRACWGPGHRENNPVFGRLDALAEFTSPLWKESLRFMEANLCGVGGIHYVPACEELLCEVILPVLQAREPRLRLERGHDLRELLMQEVLDHLSAIGRPGRTICFIEPRYAGSGPEEQEALARYYHDRHGMTVLHADPTELALSPRTGEVTCGGLVVDLAYRDYEVRDLLALSAGGADIAPVRTLFRQNRIISSIGGEFDHKSGFELLTDPVLAQRHFSAEERHVFHRHVLWTRVLSERRTSLPAGDAGDLVGYVRREREHLVIKPNRSYGGEGVLLGPAADQGEWEAAIDRALGEPEQWVVQRVANIPVSEFPVLDASGALHIEPFYTVMGFAATEDGLGILCRASQKQVVNVAQRGGMCGVLVGHPPGEIVGPAHLPSLAGMTGRAPARDAYPALVARARELVDFEGVLGLLGWDEETCLPEAGRVPRGRQLALIEGLRHERLTDPALGELIEEVAAALPSAAEAEADTRTAMVACLRRRRGLALRVPADLVRAMAEARSRSLAAWEAARRANDHRVLAPALHDLLGLLRERAAALGAGGDPYDALLDENEPGMTRAKLDPVLRELREGLVPLAQAIAAAPPVDRSVLDRGPFPEAEQWRLTLRLLTDLGFDFQRGRQDRSTHPFTQVCSEHDVRLTTRVDEANPLSALLATAHEAGHALYDQGFSPAHHGTPLADGPSDGMHEGQARLWENQVCRSRAFWTCYQPVLAEAFPHLRGVSAEALYRAVNAVQPSLRRVEADEVTYNLHILLRYDLEQALLRGDLLAADLPAAFSQAMRVHLGIVPPDDVSGCLQDVHWAIGLFGYFPTYAIGNLYAAQLMAAYERAAAGRDPWTEIARGDFAPLLGWLRENVHRRGRLKTADEIIADACGAGLDTGPLLSSLRRKYGEMYGL